MKKASIAILTGNHLCHNPRVIKEATALQAAGYEVEVLGGWLDPILKARDLELMAKVKFNFRPLHDLTEQAAFRFGLRLRGRLANMLHEKFCCENHWQLGYFVSALQKEIRRCKPDLAIAHSEPALWAIAELQKSEVRSQKTDVSADLRPPTSDLRLGVDMEDWFSEDLLPEARKQRPVKLLRSLEQRALSRASHSTCTSRAMSEALAKEYGCRPPTVIYNAFPWSDRAAIDGQFKDRRNHALPSIHWYSQTLGAGRGLEDLFTALPYMKQEFEIHLRGKPVNGFQAWLQTSLPEAWRSRVFVHDLVSNDELLSRIAEHDIGFAGEMKYCPSRDLTVTNKILHYLLGGLAVIASDTAGQKEIADKTNGALRIYRSGDAASLANTLNALLSSSETLHAAKAAALVAAEKEFCWERQVPILLKSVATALVQIRI